MKKRYLLLSLCFLIGFGLSQTACSQKTGCPVNENAQIKPNRKGQLPTKRGKSSLFPKRMTKKKRRN